MIQNNVNSSEVAKLLGVSISRVNKMRKQKVNLRIFDLVRLMATLGKDPEDMFKTKK